MPVEFLQREGAFRINVDHHHDNTRFGDINLIDTEASCTAEIVYEIAKRLGATVTPEIAAALYVGVITDTGKFMYENTGAPDAPGGRRADRRRRRRRRHLPPPLRAGAAREAAPDRPRAREDRALRRRPARGHLHLRRGLRGDRRQRDADRGRDRLPALARRDGGGRGDPRQDRRQPRPPARSACAPATAPSTSRRSRAARAGEGIAAPPGSAPTCPTNELVEYLRAEVAEQLD